MGKIKYPPKLRLKIVSGYLDGKLAKNRANGKTSYNRPPVFFN